MADLLQVLAWVAGAVLLALAVVVGGAVLLARRLLRAGRRRLARSTPPRGGAAPLLPRGRGTAGLVVRARLYPPGPRREAAALRLALADASAPTAACLGPAAGSHAGLDGLAPLAARLGTATRSLDGRLAAVEHERDAPHRAAGLAALRQETTSLLNAAADLRASVRALQAEAAAPQTRALVAELGEQAARLRATAAAHRELRGA